MDRRRRRRLIGAAAALAIVGLGWLLHVPALRAMGQWLVVDDPLTPADAIVVVAGGTPGREVAAAELFRRRLAPRVILSRAGMSLSHIGLMELGIRAHDYQTEARLVLEKSGVPADAVVLLRPVVRITETELRVVHATAARAGYRRVILVTSADHTRRVRMIWARAGQGIDATIHAVRDETFDPDEWWRWRRMAELVLHEYLGIAAVALDISDWLQ